MKFRILIPVILFSLGMSFGQTVPAIPRPFLTLNEAVLLADQKLKIDFKNDKHYMNLLQVDNFIAISAKFEKESAAEKKKLSAGQKGAVAQEQKWFWYVKFVHPEHSDHYFLYRISKPDDALLVSTSD